MMPRKASPFGLDIYRDLREKWVHEDELVNHRVTWLLTSQAFALSAFGILVKLRLDWSTSHFPVDALVAQLEPWSLAEVLSPFLSALILSGLGRGIDAAFEAMNEIKRQLRQYQATYWYGLASNAGYARSEFHLGELYFSGHGVRQDATAARELMKKAAAGGDVDAVQWLLTHW
jgi:hypothetical protein